MSTVIPPVPHEPIKIPKKGKGLPDVVMVTAISCKAGGGEKPKSACAGGGTWPCPGCPPSLATDIILAVVWNGEGGPGMVLVRGVGESGSSDPWENRLVPPLTGQLVHYFIKISFIFFPK